MDWEKIFANHVSNKELMYKKIQGTHTTIAKKPKQPNLKNCQRTCWAVPMGLQTL